MGMMALLTLPGWKGTWKKRNRTEGVAGDLGFQLPSSSVVRWRKNKLAQKEAALRRIESTEPANEGEGKRGGRRSLGPQRLGLLGDGGAGSEEWMVTCSPRTPGGLFALGPVY